MPYSYEHFIQIILKEINCRIKRSVRILDFSRFFSDIPAYQLQDILPAEIEIISPPALLPELIVKSKLGEIQRLSLTPNFVGVFLYDFSSTAFGKRIIAALKSANVKIRIVASPTEIIKFARKNKEVNFYFFAFGFEPLAAIIAASVLAAQREKLNNLYLLTELYQSSAIVPILFRHQNEKFDGIFFPGQVVAPLGYLLYEEIINQFSIPGIVIGTETPDILQAVAMVLAQIEQNIAKLEIQYRPGVRPQGNPMARQKLETVFTLVDSNWMVCGTIPRSQFVLKEEFAKFKT
ncbi:MAG: hypothetical protein QME64_04155 [bacterium]|nr:hypothetical protein [bacterium]